MGTLEQTSDGPSEVRIDTSHQGGVLSVEVTGALDAASVHRLTRTVESLSAPGEVIRIDLHGIESVAISELGALLRMHQRGVNHGRCVTWIGLPRLLIDVVERFGIPGAFAAYLGASLASASRARGRDSSEQEFRDAT